MELVIFIGLQASGKSTFFHNYLAATHELVSKDLMRNNKNPARRQAQLVEAALQAGRSIVVDNTNPTVEERASLIGLGNLYGAQILGYYFESKVSDCLERNQQRAGKARVPEVGIYATIKKLVRPSYSEGFHQLFFVQIAGDSDFDVRSWAEGQVVHE
jgi:predicted kinase